VDDGPAPALGVGHRRVVSRSALGRVRRHRLGRANDTPFRPSAERGASVANRPLGLPHGPGRSAAGSSLKPTATAAPASVANLVAARVPIPAIGVDSSLIGLGLNADNTIEVPKDFGVARWYIYRPVPGEPGPSVIAGHVDSRVGPAVFVRLKELQPGATIDVDRNDGSTARFTVTGIEQHDKDAFPGGTGLWPDHRIRAPRHHVRRTFDWSSRHYNDNIIVFGTLIQIVRTELDKGSPRDLLTIATPRPARMSLKLWAELERQSGIDELTTLRFVAGRW